MTEGSKEEEAYHKVGRLEANRPLAPRRRRCPETRRVRLLKNLSINVLHAIWAAHDLAVPDDRDGRAPTDRAI